MSEMIQNFLKEKDIALASLLSDLLDLGIVFSPDSVHCDLWSSQDR